MRYQAVIFDLDGTLVDTLDDLADSVNQALADVDLPPHPVAAYRFFVGQGMKNLITSAAPGTDGETRALVLARMTERYGNNWHNKSKPYPGIPGLVTALKEKGLKLAVLSNKPDVFTQLMVRHFFGDSLFDVVRGEIEGTPRKPDPAGALAIAQTFAVAREQILYVGDTNTDMQTGLAAGMFTVGVTWGFRPVQELRQAGAEALVDRADQILDLVQGLP